MQPRKIALAAVMGLSLSGLVSPARAQIQTIEARIANVDVKNRTITIQPKNRGKVMEAVVPADTLITEDDTRLSASDLHVGDIVSTVDLPIVYDGSNTPLGMKRIPLFMITFPSSR